VTPIDLARRFNFTASICDVFHEPCCKVVDTSSSQYNYQCD